MQSDHRISCLVAGDGSKSICLTLPDGGQLDIPPDLVARSTLLQDAIFSAEDSGEFHLVAPAELHSWVQYARDLAVDTETSAPVIYSMSADQMAQCLMVCSYVLLLAGGRSMCSQTFDLEQLKQKSIEAKHLQTIWRTLFMICT